MFSSIKKKKILILGGSSDISKELIKNIDTKKYQLFLHYNKNKPHFNSIKLNTIKTDFTNINEKKINSLLKKFKNFDIIINLIGYIDGKTYFTSNYKNLLKSLNANFIIPLLIIKNSIKHMKKNKFGRIVNCSSIGTKFGGGENTYNYSLSKHCSEFIPKELKKISNLNILINNIKLGVINTKIHKKTPKKNMFKRINLIPLKRMGKTSEVVKLILFLINENTFISSETINLSGGE